MSVVIQNKKARFEYEIIDSFTAGVALVGSEVKSIRANRASLVDAYCVFIGEELFIKNLHIAEYAWASQFNHEPRRVRKLLLTKRELRRLQAKVKEKGFTIVPLKLFFGERGYVKVEIALARGKKSHDKRQSIKDRDISREMDRDRSNYKSSI
jgi:SsrA-binding protein